MQIVLAMIEAGRVRADLALDDPLAAVRAWSHDPLLETRMPLVSGEPVTAPELQLRFLDEAERHVASGALDELVPRAAEIASLWADTLDRLRRRDWPSLARRLDWVLKLSLLEGAMRQRPALGWSAPEVKHLDHLYASLDPAEGLFWSLAGRGLLEEVVERADVERFTHEPPADTRAWGRAMLLRRAPQDAIDLVDWDFIRFRLRRPGGPPSYWALDLGGPLESTRDKLGPVLERTQTLEQLLFALGGQTERRAGYGGGTIHQDRTALPPPGPASRGSARPGPR
jgi:proteasome accessory factor A